MLQSAIFADLQTTDLASPAAVLFQLGRQGGRKGSFARVTAWGRGLLSRNDLSAMSSHLRRDIGLGE